MGPGDLPAVIGAVASVLLPVALGFAILTALARTHVLSRSERLALAYPLGAVLIAAAIYALGFVGLRFTPLNFTLVAAGLAPLCAGTAALLRKRAPSSRIAAATPPAETVDKREPHPSRRSQKKGPPQGERTLSFEDENRTARPEEPPPEQARSFRAVSKGLGGVSKGACCRKSTTAPLGWILPVMLAGLAAGTAGFVLFEVLHRPLSPADSFTVWGLRAKVWATRGSLVLDPHDPFYLGGAIRPDYPPYVSLLQVWSAIWLGRWSDVYVNIPWACYYASALLFVLAMLSRRVPWGWALCGSCLLATTPLFVAHTAMAGYADLMLSVHFLVAVVAAYLWTTEGERAHLAIAVLFTASLLFIKLEGILLAAVCVGGMGLQAPGLRRHGRRWLVLGGAVIAALWAVWHNGSLHALLASFRVHADAVLPVLASLGGAGNFAFLWPLFFALGLLVWKSERNSPLAWLYATTALPLLPFCGVFVCTDAAAFAGSQTAAGRLFLSLTPAAVCAVVLAAAHLASPAIVASGGRMPGRKQALFAGVLLLLGLAGAAGSVRGPAAQWRMPSPEWQADRRHGILRYMGPPLDLDGSPGLAVAVAPGIDAGFLQLAWRRDGETSQNAVVTEVRRTRPYLFINLSADNTWNGRLSGLALMVPPEMLDAVQRLDLAAGGARAALLRSWVDFVTPEIFDASSINFLAGAPLGPLPLSLAAAGLLFGLVVLAVITRRRHLPWKRISQVTLGLWVLCSARFAWDLYATFRVDASRFGSAGDMARVDSLEGEFTALVAAVNRMVPPDAPIEFLSQLDAYRDRAQYAFYPRLVVNWFRPHPSPVHYAVLFRPDLKAPAPHRPWRILAAPSRTSWIMQYQD
jgi:hypothetical protein